MGIQINGQTDTISASDGSLSVSGQELTNVTDINASGIVTATTFNGDVKVATGSTISGGTNYITASTNGSERVRIDSSGNIGIGTDTPISSAGYGNLSLVNTNGGQVEFKGTTANKASYIYGAEDLNLYTGTGGDILFYTNASERTRIYSGGTVGINTDGDPTAGGFATPQVYVKSTSTSWTGGIHLEAPANDSVGVINHSNDGLEISQTYRSGGSYQPIIFRTSGTERLRIDASGRVTLPYQPSFRVYAPTGATSNIITFGSTEFNIGSHMNAATGVFTAPIAGRYLFTFSILCGNPMGSYVRINFCKNSTSVDTTLGDALWDGLTTYGSPGMAMILSLAANDTIRLRVEGSPVYGVSYGSFSGCLLT